MVEDIRPSMPKNPEDPNTQTDQINTPVDNQASVSPTHGTVNGRPYQIPNSEQSGFVVLPDGRGFSKNPFKKLKNLSKKHKIILAALVALFVLGGGGGAYAYVSKNQPAPPVQSQTAPVVAKPVEPPKPTTEASRLTGVQISPELNKRPITSIQIENSPEARPQSGLKDAGVIFEAIAEGGITRFNASFLEAQPDYIGPIRSVRPYYASLVAPFDPIFVHAGGSADGLAKLRALGLKDLDHGANGAAFQRVSDRYAPHNLYSSTAALDKASQARGFTTSNVKSFTRKEEKKGQAVAASQINLTISSALYNVNYAYEPTTNTYKRTLGGKPHTDHRSGEQLAPKVVVAMEVPFSQSGIYSIYQVIGSGGVSIFQDGQVYKGTWTKASDAEQILFKDAAGAPIALNAGQTWISLIKNATQVSFTP